MRGRAKVEGPQEDMQRLDGGFYVSSIAWIGCATIPVIEAVEKPRGLCDKRAWSRRLSLCD